MKWRKRIKRRRKGRDCLIGKGVERRVNLIMKKSSGEERKKENLRRS